MEKKVLPFLSGWGLGAGGGEAGELWLVCKMKIKSFEIKKKSQGEMVLKTQKGLLFQD